MWKLYTIQCFILVGILTATNSRGQAIAPTGNLSRLLQQYRNTTTADTNHVRALLQLSNWYLTRAGEDRTLLDSSTLLATQAATLSHNLDYPEGREEAWYLITKTAFKERSWPRVRRLLAECDDSTRVRLAITFMEARNFVKEFSARDSDTALALAREILATPTQVRSPLRQFQLLVRIAIYYRCRYDSVGSTDPTLQTVDFNRRSGAGNWCEALQRWLSFHLRRDPVSLSALAASGTTTPATSPTANIRSSIPLDAADPAIITALQSTAARAICYEAGRHWNQNDLVTAEKEYLLAVDMARKCSHLESTPYYNIVEFYLSNGNNTRALYYGLEAVGRLQTTGNPGLEYEPWWCLGQINYELGKPTLARGYYDTVLAIMHRRNQNPDAWLFKSITQSYLKENKPGSALDFLLTHVVHGDMGEPLYRLLVDECFADSYFDLGDYDKAEQLYLDCYALGSRINLYNQSLAAYSLGRLYLRKKQYDKTRSYLLPLLQPENYFLVPLYLQRDVHLYLYKADSATGDYLSAMRHLRMHQSLSDSLFDIARNGQLQELTVKYETEKKDHDLKLQLEHIRLLQNQAELQKATLQQVRSFRNTLIYCSVLLVLLLGVGYNRYRIKQKSNRLLKVKQLALNNTNQELQRLAGRQQKLLAEKEWLINEVHHRVKTNLQIVTSLLNMQCGYLNDEFTLHAFGEIGSRIRTLSLIHQRLYREEGDLTMINMRDYIHELSAYLLDTYDNPDVRINQQIEPIDLNIAQCVPVGLILNEAITNALHFAFPARPAANLAHNPPTSAGEGTICISMHQDPAGRITLTIADNGIGLPPGFDPERDAAMGLQLIQTLGQQLDGETFIENRMHPPTAESGRTGDCHGLAITVIFQRQESDLPPM